MNTEERIRKIVIEHLGVKADAVVSTASFVDDLGADSLDTVEILMAIEEDFDIEIDELGIKQTLTLAQAVAIVEAEI